MRVLIVHLLQHTKIRAFSNKKLNSITRNSRFASLRLFGRANLAAAKCRHVSRAVCFVIQTHRHKPYLRYVSPPEY